MTCHWWQSIAWQSNHSPALQRSACGRYASRCSYALQCYGYWLCCLLSSAVVLVIVAVVSHCEARDRRTFSSDAIGHRSARRRGCYWASCCHRHVGICPCVLALHRKANCTDSPAYHRVGKACSSWLSWRTCFGRSNTSSSILARRFITIAPAIADEKVSQQWPPSTVDTDQLSALLSAFSLSPMHVLQPS